MKYFDAHTHTNFVAYDEDRDAVMARSAEAGVGMNIVGTQLDTSRSAVALAERYADVWATIGLHPVHTAKSFHDTKELGEGGKEFTSRGEVFAMDTYLAMGKSPKVIAVGECGLDYYRLDADTKKIQQEAFVAQIELANSLGKPLMLHIRNGADTSANAYLDSIELLEAHAKVRGDVHFFAGDQDIARRFLDLGFTLSFTGVVTFTHDYDEVVRLAPLDMILSETDAPYITPVPYRGQRNEPAYVVETVKAIARIRGEDADMVRLQILANTGRIFGIS